MDLNVRFWYEEKEIVENCYLRSELIGHATAENLLKAFKNATQKLVMMKEEQVACDGPIMLMRSLLEIY